MLDLTIIGMALVTGLVASAGYTAISTGGWVWRTFFAIAAPITVVVYVLLVGGRLE